MTISDTDKLDLLFKHAMFGVAKTADVDSKSGSNETIMSPMALFDKDLWTSASSIPAVAPSTDTAIVALHIKDKAIKLSADPTAPANMTWLSSLISIIPASFGVSYAARLWIGDPTTTNSARLYPDTSGEEWLLDGNAGVLLFPNATPVSKVASNGTTVSLADNGLFLEAYTYIGPKGFPEALKQPQDSFPVGSGLTSPAIVGNLLAGSRIASIEIDVMSAFDGDAGLLIGNSTTNDFYAGAILSDLAYPGVYVVTPPAPSEDVELTVSLTGAPTVGAALVRFQYA